MNIDKYRDEFEKRLKKELKPHMGKPVCISGGIDSGVLAALVEPEFVISVDLPGGEKYGETKYAKKVAKHLGVKHIIVKTDAKEFDTVMRKAVRIIGRPIPHFNIFPLYKMYEKLAEMGVKEVILGDGPDETLMGYARDLIFINTYTIAKCKGMENYQELIWKVLPAPHILAAKLTGKTEEEVVGVFENQKVNIDEFISMVDIALMRPDMDDMSNAIAASFGIKNIRPYQDNPGFDKWQLKLPMDAKVFDLEYGKYVLRKVAEKYLPKDIAWRVKKVGGPVYPVNLLKKWDKKDGEFGKTQYLKYQENILKKRKK